MVGEQPSVPKYFPALDGLRLLCCSAVVVGHAFVGHPLNDLAMKLSGMGVNVFFSLSGFLITTLLLRELRERGAIDLKAFYLRRLLRIFPVYYAAVALGIGLLLVFKENYARPFGTHYHLIDIKTLVVSHVLFLANWVDITLPSALDVLWSVCVEEQFYLLFPFAFAFAALRPAARASGAQWAARNAIVVGLLVTWSARAWLAMHNPPGIYRNTFAHGDHLVLGALLAQVLHEKPAWLTSLMQRLKTVGQVAVLAAIAGLVYVESKTRLSGVAIWFDYLLSAILSTSLVAVVGLGEGAVSRGFARKWPRFLGQITYAGYVFHMYAVAVAWFVFNRVTQDVRVAAPLRTVLALVLTFVIAYVVRVTFEARVLALKARFTRLAPTE